MSKNSIVQADCRSCEVLPLELVEHWHKVDQVFKYITDNASIDELLQINAWLNSKINDMQAANAPIITSLSPDPLIKIEYPITMREGLQRFAFFLFFICLSLLGDFFFLVGHLYTFNEFTLQTYVSKNVSKIMFDMDYIAELYRICFKF